MSLKFPVSLRFLIALTAIMAFSFPALPALGQGATSTTTMISIDAPTEGSTITNGVQIDIGGWAADTVGPGTGVDMVRVYLDGRMDADGKLLGNANYGGNRPDVATALGNPAFQNSGFDLLWTPSGLMGGTHTLYVYAHSIANGWAYKTVTVNAPAQPTPAPARGQQGMPYGGGYGGGYGGQMTPYGGTFLNSGPYGGAGYGGGYGCQGGGYGYYDFYSTGCQIPPPPPYPPYGGGIPPFGGGGISYQQTVSVVAPPGGIITLSWYGTPAAQTYRIYQSTGTAPQNFGFVQAVPQSTGIIATNATVTGLVPGQTYYFQVRAVDPSGLETVVPAYSPNAGLYGGIPPFFPPTGIVLPAPTGVTVTGVTGTTVTLTWAAVPGAVTYRIEQALAANGVFGPAVQSNTTTTTAIVSGLTLSTAYQFRVIAVDGFGNVSLPSVAVPQTTTPGP